MDRISKTKKEKKVSFQQPKNIVKAKVCKKSGKLAISGVCDHDPRGSMVVTEYFEKGTVPTQTCDTHVSVELCKDSGYPVTKKCPQKNRKKKVYVVRSKNSLGITADTPYLLPKKYQDQVCKLHK